MSGTNKEKSKRPGWAYFAVALVVVSVLTLATLNVLKKNSDPLTPEERKWLTAHPLIRFAPDPDFPPTEFFDSNGNYAGISADFLNLIEKRLGIRFRIVRLGNWDDVIGAAQDRRIDIFAATETPRRLKYASFTTPFLELPAAIIAREKVKEPITLADLKGMKVSVVSGYAVQEFITSRYPDVRLDVVPDVQTGLRKVAFGTSDAFVENLATASHYIEKEGISNLRIVGESGLVYRISFASRSDWPELNRILEKGLMLIGNTEKRAIYRKWIPIEPKTLFASKRFQTALLITFYVIVLLIVGIIAWNRTLKKQVLARTAELEKELAGRVRAEESLRKLNEELECRVAERTSELGVLNANLLQEIDMRKQVEEELRNKTKQLEMLNTTLEQRVREESAKNRGKDILLFRQNRQAAMGEIIEHIAHQWKQPLNAVSLTIQTLEEAWRRGSLTDEQVGESVSRILSLVDHMAQTVNVFKDFYKPEKEKAPFFVKESIEKALTLIKPALRFEAVEVDLQADPALSVVGYQKEYAQVLLNILSNAREIFRERGTAKPLVTIRAAADKGKAVVTITDNAGGIPEEHLGRIFDMYFTTRESRGGTGLGLYLSKNIIEKSMGGALTVANAGEGARFRIELEMAGC